MVWKTVQCSGSSMTETALSAPRLGGAKTRSTVEMRDCLNSVVWILWRTLSMHEVHYKTVCKWSCTWSAASATAAVQELHGHAVVGWERVEVLHSGHIAVVQWYIAAGRLAQSYSGLAMKVWMRIPAKLWFPDWRDVWSAVNNAAGRDSCWRPGKHPQCNKATKFKAKARASQAKAKAETKAVMAKAY